MALGIDQVAAVSGSFTGLIVGGILAAIHWRLVFLVSVPFGLLGTIWAYLKLRETATLRANQRIDWIGHAAFALGLTILLLGLTYKYRTVRRSTDGLGESAGDRWRSARPAFAC
jgi:predicted MFS family arabinose efflux permease